jgi:tetratricopeptide (TPR) repeat protein
MALSVVAARAALEETSLQSLVHDLNAGRSALDALWLGGERESDVRLAFSTSFVSLPGDLSSAFRALVLHPGRDIDVAAAAAVIRVPIDVAKRRLGELARRNMVLPTAPARFGLHDLIRTFGLEHTGRGGFRRRALRALLNHYLHVAHRADRWINPHRRPLELARCARPELLPEIGGYDDALRVFGAEYDNLIAATRLAGREGWDDYAWQLPWTLSNYAYLTARWADWVLTHEQAVSAVRRSRSASVEARIRQSLGRAYNELGEFDKARGEYEAALLLDDDLSGKANALNGLAGVHVRAGVLPSAIECGERALTLYCELDDDVGQASTLNLLGRACTGSEPRRAIEYHEQALRLFEQAGDDYGRAQSTGALGAALVAAGRHEDAAEQLRASVELHRAVGNQRLEGNTTRHLAEVLLVLGRQQEASELAERAARLLGAADAGQGAAELSLGGRSVAPGEDSSPPSQ